MSEENAAAPAPLEEDDDDIILEAPADAPMDIRNPKILNLPVQIRVSVGKAQMTVEQLMALTPETVVELDAHIDDPAEIFVGERLVARGELVQENAQAGVIGVRLVEICDEAV